MAGNVDGYQFDSVKVSAANDAKLYNSLANKRSYVIKGYEQELKLSSSGLRVTVQAGSALIQGRFVYLKEAQSVTVPANSKGFIVLKIDLTQKVVADLDTDPATESYSWENNQVSLEYVSTLVNGNLNQGDKVYTFSLCSFSSTGTSVKYEKNDQNYKGYRIIDRSNSTDSGIKSGQIRFINIGGLVLVHFDFRLRDAGLNSGQSLIASVPSEMAIDYSSHVSLQPSGELFFDAQTQTVSTKWGLKGNEYYLGTATYIPK